MLRLGEYSQSESWKAVACYVVSCDRRGVAWMDTVNCGGGLSPIIIGTSLRIFSNFPKERLNDPQTDLWKKSPFFPSRVR